MESSREFKKFQNSHLKLLFPKYSNSKNRVNENLIELNIKCVNEGLLVILIIF